MYTCAYTGCFGEESCKEFRRPKKPRKMPCEKKTASSRVGKAPGITNSVKHPVPPPGEDAVSYECHTKALQVEFKKTNRNCAIITDLMDRSFAMRRVEILENNYSLQILLDGFSFLQEAEQVHVYKIQCTCTPLHM